MSVHAIDLNHGNIIVETFPDLLWSKRYADVAFVCRDSKMVQAHRLLLGAISPFLRELFDDQVCYPYSLSSKWSSTKHLLGVRAPLPWIYYYFLLAGFKRYDPNFSARLWCRGFKQCTSICIWRSGQVSLQCSFLLCKFIEVILVFSLSGLTKVN